VAGLVGLVDFMVWVSLWLGTFCAGLYLWCGCLLVLFVLGVVLVGCLLWL